MLEAYAANAGLIDAASAWLHMYRLLLWVDRTTGLAHCYESDKAQPGRPWYGRSLAFHAWVSAALGTVPANLANEIDWLFARGTERLAKVIIRHQAQRDILASEQREQYLGQGFPEPGEDPILEALVLDELRGWLSQAPPPDALRRLVQRIRTYLAQENKRKNLVGEGFEDVLAFLIERVAGGALKVEARPLLHSLPGFNKAPGTEKPRRVDLAVVAARERRVLVSAKWSIRADREEQFGVDFEAYSRLEALGQDFEFVLITNEFDAARLTKACERRRQNGALFSAVVHVNPQGPLAAYGPDRRRSAKTLAEHVASGRLMSLERWLTSLLN